MRWQGDRGKRAAPANRWDNDGTVIAVAIFGTVVVVMKLTGVIDWSWWLVTAPFWAFGCLVVGGVAFMFIALSIDEKTFLGKKR